jgi:hypothetical protein
VLLYRWERAAVGHWPADWYSPWGSLEVEWSLGPGAHFRIARSTKRRSDICDRVPVAVSTLAITDRARCSM